MRSPAQPTGSRGYASPWLTLALGLLIACLSGCASLPPLKPSAPTYAMADVAGTSLARRADKTPDVQYYQLQRDGVGLRELRDASMRGVRVRLIVDDFYTAGQDEVFASLAAFPHMCWPPVRWCTINRRPSTSTGTARRSILLNKSLNKASDDRFAGKLSNWFDSLFVSEDEL